MIRKLTVLAGLALATGVASAAFLGIEIREDKGALPATLAGARTFNIYAKFDAIASANTALPAAANAVLTTGQPTPGNLTEGFGINTSNNPGATFFQQAFGNDFAPNPALVAVFPDLGFDSFVTIGHKTAGTFSTGQDPDFGFNAAQNFITGGWTSAGGSLQGAASDGTVVNNAGTTIPSNFNAAKGTYDVLLSQLTIQGLAAGASSGEGSPLNGNASLKWLSSIFTGQLTVFTQAVGGGADPHVIQFNKIPTPGTLALFGVAGLAAGRRRRA